MLSLERFHNSLNGNNVETLYSSYRDFLEKLHTQVQDVVTDTKKESRAKEYLLNYLTFHQIVSPKLIAAYRDIKLPSDFPLHKIDHEILKKVTGIKKKIIKHEQKRLKELSLNHIKFIHNLKKIDMKRTAEYAKQILTDTNKEYKRLSSTAFEKSYFLLDKDAPKIIEGALARMGFTINIKKRYRIGHVKNTRAEKTYMLIKQDSDIIAYANAMYHAGHTLHSSNISKRLPFEFRAAGNEVMPEMYAALFENIVSDTMWLHEHIGIKNRKSREIALYLRYLRLYRIRKSCVDFIYQMKLYQNNLEKVNNAFRKAPGSYENHKECFVDMYKRGLFIQVPGEMYLYFVDIEYKSADRLNAYILESQLKDVLKKKFGKKWFFRKGAGTYLTRLFALGNSMTNEEFAMQIGHKDINPDFLRKEFSQ